MNIEIIKIIVKSSNIFFLYSTGLCFSSSGKFLHRSRPYCLFFSFSSLEDFDTFHELFCGLFLFFCNIWLINVSNNFYIDKESISKKKKKNQRIFKVVMTKT